MSRHDRFREMLARRAELTPAEEARLQQHLSSCAECRDTAEAYARQAIVLRSLGQAEPPPALRAWVLTSIQQQPQPRPSSTSPLRRRLVIFAPMAAALLILIGALAYLGGPHHPARTALRHSTPTRLSTPTPSLPLPPPRPPQPTSGQKRIAPPNHRSSASVPHARPSGIRGHNTHRVKPSSPAPAPRSVVPSAPASVPQPSEQQPVAPVVVSQQIPRALPTPIASSPAPARSPRPSGAAPAAPVRQPEPSPTPVPPTSGIPGAQPVTGSPVHVAAPNPGGSVVDKPPPEALAYVPPPAPPPPPPPAAATTPSANSIAVPATPGPTSEVQAGPNPVLVPVTPTTPIP